MKYTYILENLNCANCASKIEKKIKNTDGYKNVSFNFATKTLIFTSDKNNTLVEIQKICDSIEDGVTVTQNNASTEKSNHKLDTVFIIISAVFAVTSTLLHLTSTGSDYLAFGLSLIATVLAGYKIFLKSLKLKIDETTLLVIAVISAFILGEYSEGAMVTVLFALGELIEHKAVEATRRDIKKIAQIRPDNATIIENGIESTVSAENVKIGSTIIVKPYERIPLDGIVLSGNSMIDTSALTGESMPVEISNGSEVMSGSINGSNVITIKTTKAFGNSTATRILKLVEEASAQKSKNEKLISRFASIYTPIILAISVVMAVVPPLLGLGEFSEWIYRALVCLVASCPCAIVISVPLSYYAGIGGASKIGVLIKGGKYLEALAKADTFAFDKTGTLTSGKLSVENVISYSEYSTNDILNLSASCEKYSSHPIALAIKSKAENPDKFILSDYNETAGFGTSAIFNGKKLECGSIRLLSEEQKKSVDESYSIFLIYDGKIIGAVSVNDTLRADSKQIISELKKSGVKNCVMLTGDSKSNAEKVSRKLQLDSFKAGLLPSDKLKAVEELKKNSKAVCFVGDGINDAPVLASSDCGIAMGLGSDSAIEASDAVLTSGTLTQLPKAIKLAKKTINTVRTNIAFALAVKAIVIILAGFGIATMWMSVIADTGVSVACVLYSARLLSSSCR